MVFARYTGPDKDGESFVEGKVYISGSSFSDGETVDLSMLKVVDEDGNLIEIDQDEERFVYLDENYAAILKAFDEFEVGDVVTVSGVSDDGVMYDMSGYGYRSVKDLALLDRTNVYPGIVVAKDDGQWSRVSAVSQSLSVMFADDDVMRELSQVKIAVSDGDVMSVPLVTCVDDDGDEFLTKGKKYFLEGQRGDLYVVNDDAGSSREFFATRFIFG